MKATLSCWMLLALMATGCQTREDSPLVETRPPKLASPAPVHPETAGAPPARSQPVFRPTHLSDYGTELTDAIRFDTGHRIAHLRPAMALHPGVRAVDLPVGARALERRVTATQKTIHPFPLGMSRRARALVTDLLTFDPHDVDTVYSAHCHQAVEELYYGQHDFAALDLVADTLRARRLLNPSGSWMLSYFYQALTLGEESVERADDVALAEQWLKQNPRSAAARYVLGSQLVSWAWEARGGALAKDVDPKAWPIFTGRLTRAREVLEAGEAAHDPYLEEPLTTALMGLQASPDELHEAVLRVWAIDVAHVWAADRSYATSLLPRWGGSREAYRAFVEELVTRTRSKMGQSLYALVVGQGLGDPRFEDEIGPDWKRVSRGYNDLLRRYPGSQSYYQLAVVTATVRHDHALLAQLKSELLARKVCPNVDAATRQMLLAGFSAKLPATNSDKT